VMMSDASTAHQFTNEADAPQRIPDDEHDADGTAKLLHHHPYLALSRLVTEWTPQYSLMF
jgi:hypothetical protein